MGRTFGGVLGGAVERSKNGGLTTAQFDGLDRSKIVHEKSNPTTHQGGNKQREWRRDYTGHDGLDPSELSLSLGQARELLEDVVLACLYVGRFGRRSVVRDIPSCGRYDVGEIPFASLPCHFNYWNGF